MIKNKESLIRYCNTLSLLLFFETVRLKNYVNLLLIIAIVAVGVLSSLSLLEYYNRCWRLGSGASLLKLSASASFRCWCFVVVGSCVPSCGCVRLLQRLIVGGVLLLSSAAASTQSKTTYTFVHKFQQVIGTNRELFERVLVLLFSQQVPSLNNRCKFALANGLAGRFISCYRVRS